MTCRWTIEDIIKGLEGMILSTKFIEHDFNGIVNIDACEQAIDLLKAQEPIEPVEMIDDFYPIGDPLRTIGWRCGICGERIAGYDNFCPNCGRAVKWDD